MLKIEKQNFKGWSNSWSVTNGIIEVVVIGDIGPRITRCGFVSGQNFFKEFTDQLGRSGEPAWQPRGGHRLWIAPEDAVMSYAPDNQPCRIEVNSSVLEATGP